MESVWLFFRVCECEFVPFKEISFDSKFLRLEIIFLFLYICEFKFVSFSLFHVCSWWGLEMESTRLLFPFSPMDFLRGTMKFPFLYFRTFEDNVWNGNALYLIRCLDAGLRIEWKEDRAGIKVTATLIPSCKTTGLTNTNCIRDISTFYYTSYNILLKNWIKIRQGRLKKIFIEELQIVNRYSKMFEINSTPNLRIKKEKRKESITILRVMSSFS